MPCVAGEKEKKMGKWSEWEVEDAARTLSRAKEIQGNADLMVQVEKILKKQKKAIISSLADLKNAASKSDMEDEE